MKYLSAVTHDFSSNTLEVVWLQNVEDDAGISPSSICVGTSMFYRRIEK